MSLLLKISEDDFWKKIHMEHEDNGGVYKIISITNGSKNPINRFLGVDYNGVLYIGKANSFTDRVITLKKSISPKYKGTSHICGRRYKSNGNIAKHFPYENLYIELIPTDNPKKLEDKYLEEYFNKFGEVPPLNAIR